MTVRVRLRRGADRHKLVKAVADRLAAALGVTENRVRVYASQGMPHEEGVEDCQAWLRSRRSATGSALLRPQPSEREDSVTEAPVPDQGAADTSDASPDDLSALLDELPGELKVMPPRDAYEWLRVLKLQRQLRTEAADRISREHALAMLVERASHLRQTMLAIPRRMRHVLNDEGFALLTREIRAALSTYAAPEGYLDRLLPNDVEDRDAAIVHGAAGEQGEVASE